MGLIADSTQKKPSKQKMTKAQIINLLCSSSNLMDEQEDLTEYIKSLDWNNGQDIQSLHDGYNAFKIEKNEKELSDIANKHGLTASALKDFTDKIIQRMIFDGEKLTDLLEPLELSWKRTPYERTSIDGRLSPSLKKTSSRT